MLVAATRMSNWRLHLAKMEELLPYFHAHDQYNCGRWGPLYVSDMLELERSDSELWKFLDDGNFAITKGDIPFTAIDPDHSIEQEHKKMKIKGGFVGITRNEIAMDRHFFISPVLAEMVHEFKQYSGIESRAQSTLHHELVGSKNSKVIANAVKLVKVLSAEGNPFQSTDMYNLATYAVAPKSISQNIEQRDVL